jgi:transcriptional regulator with XRE-family HTH domain
MAESPWPHGAYIRTRRMALGLSQPALAREARVTVAMISRLESGQRRGRPPLLRDLADALQVPQAELLERAGYQTEADYSRAQESTQEAPDRLAQLRYALGAAPLRPAVRTAFMALVTELCKDPEAAFRQRFDRAVAAAANDGAPFATLRDLVFEHDAVRPTGD